MARRPFDPASLGLRKTEYRQGNVLDRAALDALVADADVVVHLAFIIMGGREESRRINLEGSHNVFAAAADAERVKRLIYTSSVAAYGFHSDNPQPLTEDVPARGSDEHYYSAEKAELEATLWDAVAGSSLDTYVFRPCIVAGAGRADADRVDPVAAAAVTADRCCPIPASASSSSTTTTSRPRWWPRPAAPARPASTTSRARES